MRIQGVYIRVQISDYQRSLHVMRKLIWKCLRSGIREMLRVHRSQVENWTNLNFQKGQKKKNIAALIYTGNNPNKYHRINT